MKKEQYDRIVGRRRAAALKRTARAVVALVVVGARFLAPATLYYSPYPPADLLPAFNPLIGAALLPLALPALLSAGSEAGGRGEQAGARSVAHDSL